MKVRWTIALLVTFLGCSLSAFAGSPQIGVLDPGCLADGSNYMFDVTGNGSNFPHFTASTNGGGVFTFCNHTDSTWTNVDFQTNNFRDFMTGHWLFYAGTLETGQSTSGTSPINCNFGTQGTLKQPFDSCTVTIATNSVDIQFFNSNDPPGFICDETNTGIDVGCVMTVSLNDGESITGDTGNWLDLNGKPVTLSGTVNTPVPEPTAIVLLASGMVAILRRRSAL